MNILLTAINAKYIHSNPAVYSLRAYACRYGGSRYEEEIRIAEYTINQPIDEILMDIYERRPDILCISCYLWNISYVEQLIREIPKVLPETKIWLGGPEVSYNAREMLDGYPGLAGVMCGEGEQTFLELMQYYHGEGVAALRDVAGIAYRAQPSGGNAMVDVCETPVRPALDLSTIPFIYEHIEDFETGSCTMSPAGAARFPAATVCPPLINASASGIRIWCGGNFSFSSITKCRR